MRPCNLLLAASIVLLAPNTVLAGDLWVKDAQSGCQIWSDSAPEPGETVRWSGQCIDGKASGDGVLYVRIDGKPIGTYDGMMAGGKLNGQGVITLKSADGSGFDRLDAKFVDGEPEGVATFVGANGDYYNGLFKDGKRSGPGVYSSANGDMFEGEFANGKPQGTGYFRGGDGEEYYGEFEAGKRHGTGILLDTNGSAYVGQFENDQPHGRGTYEAPSGDTYQGRFVNGAGDGLFVVTDIHKKQSIQTWKNGEQVK